MRSSSSAASCLHVFCPFRLRQDPPLRTVRQPQPGRRALALSRLHSMRHGCRFQHAAIRTSRSLHSTAHARSAIYGTMHVVARYSASQPIRPRTSASTAQPSTLPERNDAALFHPNSTARCDGCLSCLRRPMASNRLRAGHKKHGSSSREIPGFATESPTWTTVENFAFPRAFVDRVGSLWSYPSPYIHRR